MDTINFVEISQNCVARFKESKGPDDDNNRYVKTLYVTITEDDRVNCSYDSRILDNAYECLLIHCHSSRPISNWYNTYEIEYINHNGFNNGAILGNDCYMEIHWHGSWSNIFFSLYHGDEIIYECNPPFEAHMQSLWNAYCRIRNDNEDFVVLANLRAEIDVKKKRIQELEEQISQYKTIISSINEMIKNFGEE